MRILREKSTCDDNCETCSSLEECSKDKCEYHGSRCTKRVCPKALALLRSAKTEEERDKIRREINRMMERGK
jgi:hypothetical protein